MNSLIFVFSLGHSKHIDDGPFVMSIKKTPTMHYIVYKIFLLE